MVYAQTGICLEEWDARSSLGFWDINRSPNSSQETRLSDNLKKKRTCRIVDFAVLADNRLKIKENEKRDKYLDLAKELKKLRNMMVTLIPIVIGVLGTIPKGLIKGLEELEIGVRVDHLNYDILKIG